MLIGLDLDNTLACYDGIFPALAAGLAATAPPGGRPPHDWTKTALRDHLRACGREDEWTRLQGEAYGPAMAGARPYPWLLDFLAAARAADVGLCVVSHRTRVPLDGPPHDLHAAARDWLRARGVVHAEHGVPPERVFLEEDRAGKLRRIAALGCTHFVDDLPEFLGDRDFPGGVMRVLFDPEGRHGDDPRWLRWSGWAEGFDLLPLESWPGRGRNNRLYRVQARSGPAVLKRYFRDAADTRDRLRAEFDFATCAWNAGLRELPRPLACDHAAGLGLYAFVEGRAPTPVDIDERAVRAAWDFFARLNARRDHPAATALPLASEACFSLEAHLRCIGGRLEALEADGIAAPVRDFAHGRLRPAFDRQAEVARDSAELPRDRRCLSPSDFGFHNALLTPAGFVFLDFEYAGWDDPAKAVCDFFCQPELPVSRAHLPLALEAAGGGAELAMRVAALLPLYGIKWCAIMLNEFLPAGARRRRFAAAPALPDAARRLAQVEEYFQRMAS